MIQRSLRLSQALVVGLLICVRCSHGFTLRKSSILPPLSSQFARSNPARIQTNRYAIFGGKGKSTVIVSNSKSQKETNDKKAKTPVVSTFGMPKLDLPKKETDIDQEEREMAMSLAGLELSLEQLLLPAGAAVIAAAVYFAATSAGITVADISTTLDAFKADPTGTLQSSLEGLGPLAIIYFGAFYVAAELLALPATPLTLSAGYLFGLYQGVGVVLAAGTVSAVIGFLIGKTLLRQWVEKVLEENPKFKKLDAAIGAEGFKLLVLVRLSPIFPFSLLNYTYGASSISFPTFVAGTLLGFTPSTVGYVYTGLVGKEILLGNGTQPWYVYAGGVAVLFGFLKLVTDVATEIVEAIDEE